ncbi:MAG: ParB/RepB/Spo0J family partition protein [Candidatus Pacebacteria bacterium]|nr:ParB/RepB/Spo0J family partition protein [Candidatus Paceibacterota bacterium]
MEPITPNNSTHPTTPHTSTNIQSDMTSAAIAFNTAAMSTTPIEPSLSLSSSSPEAVTATVSNQAGSSVPLPKTGSQYFNNSIFWIEVEKIVPNPYQPRREFDPHALKDLSESIRMYGLLQPLVVTRREIIKEDGGLVVQYELISGERRLRASKLAGLIQVPVIIRAGEEDARVKLELAIIENLQREDLNAVDRARSFQRLADEFGLKHVQIAEKMGKSREYVTNSIRLLSLPEHMLTALSEKRISEGHTRPLLMLVDRPEEQETLFKEIVFKKITVREAESIARRVAVERTRKKDANTPDPEIREFETKLNQALGTRVMIEKREQGGKVVIDFFSNQDLRHLLDMLERRDGSGSAVVNSQGIPEVLKPLFNSMPEYVPGNTQTSTTTTTTTHSEARDVLNGNIVDIDTNEKVSQNFSALSSIASSLNNMGEMASQNAGDTDIIKLVHTEIEPSEFGINSFGENGMVAHLEPSANSHSAAMQMEHEIVNGTDEDNGVTGSFSTPANNLSPVDDSTPSDAKEDEDLYSIKNFSI